MSFERRDKEDDPNSEWTHPYGPNPNGYFFYDESGYLAIQIMRTPPLPAFASGNSDKATFAELKAAFNGYIALFGRYTVDEAKHVVVQHMEGCLLPGYVGADMVRPIEFTKDRLIIGDQKTLRIVTERVK